MAFSKDFLWGGAVAGNQYEGGFQEGGRGLSTLDVLTGGGYRKPRMVTYRTREGIYGESPVDSSMTGRIPEGAVGCIRPDISYPSHMATDFYHQKKTSRCLPKWGLNVSGCLSAGPGSAPMECMRSMRRA